MEWIIGFFILWVIGKVTDNTSYKKEFNKQEKTTPIKNQKLDEPSKETPKNNSDTSLNKKKLDEQKENSAARKAIIDEIIKKAIENNNPNYSTEKKLASPESPVSPASNFEIKPKNILISTTQAIPKNQIAASFNKYGITSLWHITHRNNISTILNKGLLSNKSAYNKVNPTDISDPSVQRWRNHIEPIYNRAIHEYTPLYINARNPMLYVKKDIQQELCLIEISLLALTESNFIFTDGNAASKITKFFSNVDDLDKISWDVLNAEYWNNFADGKRKRCAEVLIHPMIEPKYINHIYCHSLETLQHLKNLNYNATITKNLFF